MSSLISDFKRTPVPSVTNKHKGSGVTANMARSKEVDLLFQSVHTHASDQKEVPCLKDVMNKKDWYSQLKRMVDLRLQEQ